MLVGNTFGYDVSGGYAATADNSAPVTILLGACGDIRNLLATAGAATARAIATPARMHFTMLDGNLSMLARNAVLLHMAAELSASEDAMLAVWANHALTQQQHDVLIRSCRMLAEEPWPPWLSANYSLPGSSKGGSDGSSSSNTATSSLHGAAAASVTSSASAESALRGVFAAWAACSMPLSQLLDRRTQMMGTCSSTGLAAQARNKRLKVQPTHISMTIDYSVDLSMAAVAAACGSSKASAEAVRGDVSAYVHSGSLKLEARTQQEPAVAPNPTLLLAPDMQYTVSSGMHGGNDEGTIFFSGMLVNCKTAQFVLVM